MSVQEREQELVGRLNPQQQEAVRHVEGPLLIIAGAGSGKTRVITHRIAFLVDVVGLRAEQILAVTFTNKAAQEMRDRVHALLGGGRRTGEPLISTFHSLCVRILRRDATRLGEGLTRNFTIYDSDDSAKLVKACLADLHLDEKILPVRGVHSAISSAKNRGVMADEYAARGGGVGPGAEQRREAIGRVFKLYEQRKLAANALDFDDLLIKTVVLLRRDPEVRAYYNERFRHIMVDEYQDTNQPQFALIRLLTEKTQNLVVVGDDDQGIYAWRGADIANILSFERQYPGARVIRLEQNYRSTQNILDAAGSVIKNNRSRKGKTLWTEHGAGEKIAYYQAVDGEDEARWVVTRAAEALARDPKTRAAVLYRMNSQSRLFEEACRRAGIPYNIVGGFSFYERAEIKDTIAYLKLALNPSDPIAFNRVVNTPKRGIGKTTLDAVDRHVRDLDVGLWEALAIIVDQKLLPARATASLAEFKQTVESLARKAQELSLAEVVHAAVRDTGLEDALKQEKSEDAEARLLNLEELVNAAAESEEEGISLREFIDHAALTSDTDQYSGEAPVTLMTMHSAKGLEFPYVFVVGLEEGLMPHSRSAEDEAQLEEERRLLYVAITRAEQRLSVTHAMRRRLYGSEVPSEPSRFLNELPIDLLDDQSYVPSWLSFAQSPATRQNRHAIDALTRDRPEPVKRSTNYTGKTYDSADAIKDFFARRGGSPTSQPPSPPARKYAPSRPEPAPKDAGGLVPGARVRHPKYGVGLLLRKEGQGEDAKLTVSFPGFGQKKFVARFAQLEKV
jgi:DNA helicase-2/ATP-dependent DNA helicase PcrA